MQRQQNRRARASTRRRLESTSTHPVPLTEILQYLKSTNDASSALHALEEAARADPAWGQGGVPVQHLALWEEVVCAAGLVMLLHAARLCVALNMTVAEVHGMTPHQGRVVLRVATHKTASSGGRACVALRPRQGRLLRRVADLRRYLPGGGLDSARVLVAGNERAGPPRLLLRPFLRSLSRRHPARGLVFNDVRREVESQRFLLGAGAAEDKVAQSISSYLCHSQRVGRLHYARRTDAVVVAEARQLEELLSQLVAVDMVMASPDDFLPPSPEGPPYPLAEQLQQRLAAAWPAGGHVCLHPLTSNTQESISAWWRERHRDAFVDALARQVTARLAADEPADEQQQQHQARAHRYTSQLVREADAVWTHDACELVSFVLDALNRIKRD